MKKLFVMLLSMIMVISASAQHRYTGRHYYRPVRSRVIVSYGSYPAYYSPAYYDYGFYRPYYYRPSRLALQVEDIQSDYKDRIWSVRHDDRLSKRERKIKIHQLKSQRDDAIRNAERNYYRSY
jgi:hypothetical protein